MVLNCDLNWLLPNSVPRSAIIDSIRTGLISFSIEIIADNTWCPVFFNRGRVRSFLEYVSATI